MAWTVFLAYWIDRILGDLLPPFFSHPIIYIGRWISFWEKKLRRPEKGERSLYRSGVVLWFIVVLSVFLVTAALSFLLFRLNLWLGFLGQIWLCSLALASKSLKQAACQVLEPLQEGNLWLARQRIGRLVSRETDRMEQQDIVRATIETVAENTVDGVVSPLFYGFIGGAPLMFAYKAVNTLDSMVGYRNDKYLWFGRFSAKMDDAANYIPARLTALLMLLHAFITGRPVKRAWKTIRRDAKGHPSPNGGYPESAIAGCLGIRLGGLNIYHGRESFRAYMGEPLTILQSLHIYLTIEFMGGAGAWAAFLGFIILVWFY